MQQQLTDFGIRIVTVLGSALVLQFFSEFYFLNEGPADEVAKGLQALPGLVMFIFVYGLFAYIFHIVLDRFEVQDVAGLILAGSIFGWATEALVVPVVYEGPPISFFFPSIGWHALVDVVAGWYLLRLAMRRLPVWMLAGLFVVVGLCWGLWATWTWGSEDETVRVYSVAQFRNIVLITSLTWIAGTVLVDLGMTRRFRASWAEIIVIALFSLVLFVSMGLPFWPWMLALTALLALTLAVLWRGRGRPAGARFESLSTLPALTAYLVMPLLPVAAVLIYPLVLEYQWAVPANDIVLLLLIAGTLAFFWAIWRVFTSR